MKSGFTTVELMVALFVAVIFLFSGYQLYQVVILRNSEARRVAEASNIGYGVLRSKGGYAFTKKKCGVSSDDRTVAAPPNNTLPKPVNITISRCKPLDDSLVVRVSVKVEFGSPREEVYHAIYVSP